MNGGLVILFASAGVGAAFQHFLPYLIGAPGHIRRRLSDRTSVEGRWFSYHYTRKGKKPLLRSATWDVSRDFRGHLRARCVYQDSDSLGGTGPVFQEAGFFVIQMHAARYPAVWSIRIVDPLPAHDPIVPGLWLSADFDGELTAGPIVFSREKLDEATAETELHTRTSASLQARLLGVNRGL